MPQGGQPYDDGLGPLDVSSILPQQAGPQPQQKPQTDKRQWLKLAALLPAAMKGGPGAVEGLLQGYQQAAMQQQQQGQQQAQEQRLQAGEQRAGQELDLQRQRLEADVRQRQDAARAKLMEDFAARLPEVTNDADARALAAEFEAIGQSAGMRPGTFERQAMIAATPDRLLEKRVTSLLRGADPKLVQAWIANRGTLQVRGEPIPFEVWSQFLPTATDPTGRPITAAEDASTFTLSPGQVRFDAQGNEIARGGAPDGPRPDFEWVIRNGQPVQIQKGTARPGDRPYDAVAERAQGGAADGGPSPYATERGARTIQSVDELIGKVGRLTTGFGSILAGIPETAARNFRAELDTLKANIAFNELTQMREASKTGGALGQVSNIELNLLQSALGALDAGQSPDNLREQLQKIKESVQRWNEAQARVGTRQTGGGAGDPLGIR